VTAEFSLPIRVYIEDTDAGGIVYYVNYLKYLERARTEFMRSLGVDKAALPEADRMFVVSRVNVHYRTPARLDDELVATLVLEQLGAATIEFAQSVRRGSEVLMEGTVEIASVACSSGKPRRLSNELRARLEESGIGEIR
jgi:tol-pal system-associated acyl-CoA thioesterase